MATETKPLKCELCGREGTGVGVQHGHIGGHGDFETMVLCVKRRECWERWDKKHMRMGD